MSSREDVEHALLAMRRAIVTRTLRHRGLVLRREAEKAIVLDVDLCRYRPSAITKDQKVRPSLAASALQWLGRTKLAARLRWLLHRGS